MKTETEKRKRSNLDEVNQDLELNTSHELKLAKTLFKSDFSFYADECPVSCGAAYNVVTFLAGRASVSGQPQVRAVLDEPNLDPEIFQSLEEIEKDGIKGLVFLPLFHTNRAIVPKGIVLMWTTQFLYSSNVDQEALDIWTYITDTNTDFVEVMKRLDHYFVRQNRNLRLVHST